MKSMKAKTKTKKSNSKFGKVKFPSKEVAPIDPDLSQLRQPIDTSVSTLYRVSKVLENGSDEVRSILAYECDLVYECRVCRSLFRSLVNFISHKRIYCKQKFNVTFARNSLNDYDTTFTIESNIQESDKTFEETYGNDRILRSQVCKEEPKKDLTAVVNMLQKKQTESLQVNTERLCLETVQSNSSAVYQTVESVPTENHTDLMKTQVTELKDMISGQTAVLGQDGQYIQPSQIQKSDNVTENSSYEEIRDVPVYEVVCSICGATFSTRKTLAVHTRTLHTSHRLCYPCPCCSSSFTNTWSVYRHLFKVHRKSNVQVRKLRSQIQEKAFIKDITVAEDMQKEDANKTSLTNALRVNETQEWMDHLESDAELQRCGGCGKRFDRKAALSAHSQYCHRRVAACEGTTKIKKSNKISPSVALNENTPVGTEHQNDVSEARNSASSEINSTNEISIRVETVASLSKADWDMLGSEGATSQNESNGDVTVIANETRENAARPNLSPVSDASDPLEIVYTSISKQRTNVGSKKRKNKDSAKRLTTNTGNNVTPQWNTSLKINEQRAEVEKMDYPLTMEKKVASIVNLQKLQCLPCDRKFTSVTNLRRHAAIHIGWNRYQCKLCNFKCFDKCDCVAHCNKLHNAQNNRVVIEDMITQIPDNQCASKQDDGVPDIINVEKEPQVHEVVEVRSLEPEIQIEEETVDNIETERIDANSVVLDEVINVNGETEETSSNDIQNQNMLGLDPDLRKMVMEVIFGSSEDKAAKQGEAKEVIFLEDTNSKLENTGDTETEPDLKECNTISIQDNPKPQRPIRNKIKRLNKDFVYDLKEVAFRKDSLIMKSFNKSLAKRSVVQEENKDRDTEQSSKRFKFLQNEEVSILCENGVIDKCDIKLKSEDLKNSLTFSQCHS